MVNDIRMFVTFSPTKPTSTAQSVKVMHDNPGAYCPLVAVPVQTIDLKLYRCVVWYMLHKLLFYFSIIFNAQNNCMFL